MDEVSAEIILELTKRKGTSHTELLNLVIDQTKKSPRLVKNRISELEEKGYIGKKKVKGRGYPLYYNRTEKRTTSHHLYLMGKKGKMLFSQEDIDNLITNNEKEFEKTLQDTQDIYSEAASYMLSSLYWHNKITFAIESGWLGLSEIDVELAKKNKKRLEKFMKKIMVSAWKNDQEMWHTLLHAVHDVIDDNRTFSKEQLEKIWTI